MYPNLKQHSRLDAYIGKLAQSENALSPKEWNSFVKLLDETLGVDFKYMQIPNICFSLTDADDEREIEFKKQRLERGFDDSETWSLRDTIANFIIPRLERYEEMVKDFIKREPELDEDIECFLNAMKLVARDNGTLILTKEEEEQMRQGLEAFPKVFMILWW
jgi:hypothetical protein